MLRSRDYGAARGTSDDYGCQLWPLLYFVLAATAGLAFILMQRRQAGLIRGINQELSQTNDFLATISMKIAKYLSPQIYKSIFSGQKDVAITTERKKLTIFYKTNFNACSTHVDPYTNFHLQKFCFNVSSFVQFPLMSFVLFLEFSPR